MIPFPYPVTPQKAAALGLTKLENVPPEGLGEDPPQLVAGLARAVAPSFAIRMSLSMEARRRAAEAVREHLAAVTADPLFGRVR